MSIYGFGNYFYFEEYFRIDILLTYNNDNIQRKKERGYYLLFG